MSIIDKYLNQTFTVIDIETTGLALENSEIIEIAGVKILPDLTIDYSNTFQELIRPKKMINEYSHAYFINKISNNMLKNKLMIEDIIPKFITFFDNTVIVGHNISFDMKFIDEAIHRLNCTANYIDKIDTIPLARKAYPEIANHRLDTLISYLNIECEIDKNMRHRALYDAVTTAKLFIKTVDKLNQKDMA